MEQNIIDKFQEVLDTYYDLVSLCKEFSNECDEEDDLRSDASFLEDFVKEELGDRIDGVKNSILDTYYPIDYADDEEDYEKAGDRYRSSKEEREDIFNE